MSRVKKKPKKEFSKVWLGCVGAVTLVVTAFTLAIVWKTGGHFTPCVSDPGHIR